MHSYPSAAPSRSLLGNSRVVFGVALAALVLALLALRVALWRYLASYDLLTAFLPWQTYLLTHGRWHALRHPLGIYFPAYYDVAILTSYLDGHFNRVSQIKLVSFCFDLIAALTAYLMVGRIARDSRLGPRGYVAQLFAPFCILAGPTVLLNGSAWGQSDIVFTTFLLMSTYAVISGMGAAAALLFGFALAFKLQAVFFVPFLGAMLLSRRIRWVHVLLIPVGWLVALVPALLNGGSIAEFLKLLFSQGDTFPVLAINIGNPWTALMLLHFNEHIGTLLGVALTILVTIALSLWGRRPAFQSPVNTLMLASFSLLVMPYIMPRMHDRYFFPAEVFLCILSCIDLSFALPAALVLSASLISYSNYFLYHVRYTVIAAALLANTAALWLAFHLVRLRVASAAPAQNDTAAPAMQT
jgi:Gpi18-like mannosyltransferase